MPDLDSLVIYQSYIALCEIRFRTMTGVRTVVARTTIRTLVRGPGPNAALRGLAQEGVALPAKGPRCLTTIGMVAPIVSVVAPTIFLSG